jgi:hypothetical protein
MPAIAVMTLTASDATADAFVANVAATADAALQPEVRLYQMYNNQQEYSSWTEALRAVRLGVSR